MLLLITSFLTSLIFFWSNDKIEEKNLRKESSQIKLIIGEKTSKDSPLEKLFTLFILWIFVAIVCKFIQILSYTIWHLIF